MCDVAMLRVHDTTFQKTDTSTGKRLSSPGRFAENKHSNTPQSRQVDVRRVCQTLRSQEEELWGMDVQRGLKMAPFCGLKGI